MTPTQALTELARILSVLAGTDSEGLKIPVRLGYKNRVMVAGKLNDNTPASEVSSGYLLLFFDTRRPPARSSEEKLLSELYPDTKKDRLVNVVSKNYEAFFTLQAYRCGALDLLHKVEQELDPVHFEVDRHEDFTSIPRMGDILDITSISDGDEFEDRAETSLTVKYCDRSVSEIKCATICVDPVAKINTALIGA